MLKLNYTKTNPPQLSSKKIQVKWMEQLTPDIPFTALLNTLSAAWTIGGKSFDVTMENVPKGEIVRLERRSGLTDKVVPCPDYLKAKVAPSSLEGTETMCVEGGQFVLPGKLKLLEEKFSANLGECFHSYAAVAVPGNDDVELAKSLIGRWGVAEIVSADEIVAAVRRLREWIAANLKPKAIHAEIPMSYSHPDGRTSAGFIDMLVEQEDGSMVLIDHKVINDEHAKTCVKKYAPQQEIYRNALMAVGANVTRVCLHLPAQSKLVEIKFA